jgi:hypothetical protein
LDLGLAKSSIVGNDPKSPIDVRKTIRKSKAKGPTIIIQINRIKRDELPFFKGAFVGERFLSAIVNLKIHIEFKDRIPF